MQYKYYNKGVLKMKITIRNLLIINIFVVCMISATSIKVSADKGAWTVTVHDKNKKEHNVDVKVETLSGYDADCTRIKVLLDNATKRTVVVDVGDEKSAKKLEDKNGNLSIHDLILTHNHGDHINGLDYISKKKDGNVYIKNLYVNTLNYEHNKNKMYKYLKALVKNKKVKIEKIFSVGPYQKQTKKIPDIKSEYKNKNTYINVLHTGCQIIVLPPVDDFGGKSSAAVNNNSMMVVVRDNSSEHAQYKIILPGDIQGGAMEKILEKDRNGHYIKRDYIKYLQPDNPDKKKDKKNLIYQDILYKASHHGKGRWHDFLELNKDPKKDDTVVFGVNTEKTWKSQRTNEENMKKPEYQYLRGLVCYDIKCQNKKGYSNDKNYQYTNMGLYEKELIKLINPKAIIASQYTKAGTDNQEKGKFILANAELYKRYIRKLVPNSNNVYIRGRFQSKSDVKKTVDLSKYFLDK